MPSCRLSGISKSLVRYVVESPPENLKQASLQRRSQRLNRCALHARSQGTTVLWVRRLPDGGLRSRHLFVYHLLRLHDFDQRRRGRGTARGPFCELASLRFDRETARIGLPLRETLYPNLCQTGGICSVTRLPIKTTCA